MGGGSSKDGIKERLREVLKSWDITPRKIRPYKDVFVVRSKDGYEYSLKPLEGLSYERIHFIGDALEYIKAHGYPHIAGLIRNSEGGYSKKYDGFSYILSPWIRGIKPKRYDRQSLVFLGERTSAFHNASCDFPAVKASSKVIKGELYEKTLSKIRSFESRIAKLSGIGADPDLCGALKRISDHSYASFERIDWNSYKQLINDRSRIAVCHGDLAPRNLILDNNNALWIIDFDSMVMDLRLFDIWRYLRRELRNKGWEYNIAKSFLEGYSEGYSFRCEEHDLLSRLFGLPTRIWRLTRKLFKEDDKKRLKLLNRLSLLVNDEDKRWDFIGDFRRANYL